MPTDPAIEALRHTALLLWHCASCPTPFTARVVEWMSHPEPGDLVFEVSTFRDEPKSIGHLIARDRDEWLIRTFEGEEVKWANATFVRLPTSRDDVDALCDSPPSRPSARR